MGLLRRRRRETQDVEPPRAEPAARLPVAGASADAWRPSNLQPRGSTPSAAAPPAGADQAWAPAGVEPEQRRRSRPSNVVPTEALEAAPPAAPQPPASAPATSAPAASAAAPAPASAPAPAPAAPAPPAVSEDREELRARIASLEKQSAAQGGPSGEQSATIRSLQARLAEFEDELRKSSERHGRPAPPAATAMRVSILVLVFAVIAGSPLYMSRRSTCPVRGKSEVKWSIVKPFDDSGPARCKNELGGTVVLDAVGL
jgi:hypothetical protein